MNTAAEGEAKNRARVLGKGNTEGRNERKNGVGADRADLRAQHSPGRAGRKAPGGECLLVTKGTLVLTPGYKEEEEEEVVAEEEGYERLRNNAPPPALVSSHSFNWLDGGYLLFVLLFLIRCIVPVNNDQEHAQNDEIERILLVNINCPLKLILNYIRSAIGLNESVEFDLCDEDQCQLKKTSFYEPYTSGLNIFQANLSYLIVMYERGENGKIVNYVPLINGKAARRCTDTILKPQIIQRKGSSNKSISKRKS
ncbi:uncharacterized protein LOC143174902 [Nomia melanderi]|uniref:uncharacterized protein LOC143174902 n=1 Tax=Nomia melanderi TaxID=2448451 RepID=UPI003FCDD982